MDRMQEGYIWGIYRFPALVINQIGIQISVLDKPDPYLCIDQWLEYYSIQKFHQRGFIRKTSAGKFEDVQGYTRDRVNAV